MDRRLLKEQELNQAIDEMEKISSEVKRLTKSVKMGLIPKTELQRMIHKLKKQENKVKILSAESKIYGQWKGLNEVIPSSKGSNNLYLLISVLALLYIAKK